MRLAWGAAIALIPALAGCGDPARPDNAEWRNQGSAVVLDRVSGQDDRFTELIAADRADLARAGDDAPLIALQAAYRQAIHYHRGKAGLEETLTACRAWSDQACAGLQDERDLLCLIVLLWGDGWLLPPDPPRVATALAKINRSYAGRRGDQLSDNLCPNSKRCIPALWAAWTMVQQDPSLAPVFAGIPPLVDGQAITIDDRGFASWEAFTASRASPGTVADVETVRIADFFQRMYFNRARMAGLVATAGGRRLIPQMAPGQEGRILEAYTALGMPIPLVRERTGEFTGDGDPHLLLKTFFADQAQTRSLREALQRAITAGTPAQQARARLIEVLLAHDPRGRDAVPWLDAEYVAYGSRMGWHDIERAEVQIRRRLEELATAGDPLAQTVFGEWLYTGDGVSESVPAAIRWWQLAAAQGSARAQALLATIAGRGLPGSELISAVGNP